MSPWWILTVAITTMGAAAAIVALRAVTYEAQRLNEVTRRCEQLHPAFVAIRTDVGRAADWARSRRN